MFSGSSLTHLVSKENTACTEQSDNNEIYTSDPQSYSLAVLMFLVFTTIL